MNTNLILSRLLLFLVPLLAIGCGDKDRSRAGRPAMTEIQFRNESMKQKLPENASKEWLTYCLGSDLANWWMLDAVGRKDKMEAALKRTQTCALILDQDHDTSREFGGEIFRTTVNLPASMARHGGEGVKASQALILVSNEIRDRIKEEHGARIARSFELGFWKYMGLVAKMASHPENAAKAARKMEAIKLEFHCARDHIDALVRVVGDPNLDLDGDPIDGMPPFDFYSAAADRIDSALRL